MAPVSFHSFLQEAKRPACKDLQRAVFFFTFILTGDKRSLPVKKNRLWLMVTVGWLFGNASLLL